MDEAGLQRALYCSSMREIEYILGPVVKNRRIVVEGHLSGTGRTAIERLGAEVEELRSEDEKRYIDMTPVIFVVAAAMAVRYVSLGLDDQSATQKTPTEGPSHTSTSTPTQTESTSTYSTRTS